MGLVTYKRSIGSRHPSRILLPAGPGLHCLGWPSVSSSDMSRSLPATSCTGVRRVSLPRSYPHPLYKVRIIESSELLDSFSVQIVLSIIFISSSYLHESRKECTASYPVISKRLVEPCCPGWAWSLRVSHPTFHISSPAVHEQHRT